MKTVLLGCGHAYTVLDTDRVACPICFGIVPGANRVVEPPDLTERVARCEYYGRTVSAGSECNQCRVGAPCQCECPSSLELAFFEYRPNREFDSFYCGCRSYGWD